MFLTRKYTANRPVQVVGEARSKSKMSTTDNPDIQGEQSREDQLQIERQQALERMRALAKAHRAQTATAETEEEEGDGEFFDASDTAFGTFAGLRDSVFETVEFGADVAHAAGDALGRDPDRERWSFDEAVHNLADTPTSQSGVRLYTPTESTGGLIHLVLPAPAAILNVVIHNKTSGLEEAVARRRVARSRTAIGCYRRTTSCLAYPP